MKYHSPPQQCFSTEQYCSNRKSVPVENKQKEARELGCPLVAGSLDYKGESFTKFSCSILGLEGHGKLRLGLAVGSNLSALNLTITFIPHMLWAMGSTQSIMFTIQYCPSHEVCTLTIL